MARKNRLIAVILAILFGPIGLLYASPVGAIILTIIAIASAPTVIGPAACWIFSIALADHAAHRHNVARDQLIRDLRSR